MATASTPSARSAKPGHGATGYQRGARSRLYHQRIYLDVPQASRNHTGPLFGGEVIVTRNDRTLSGLPRWDARRSVRIFFGAVLIGPFEGSRWRGGCGRAMGFGWVGSASAGA